MNELLTPPESVRAPGYPDNPGGRTSLVDTFRSYQPVNLTDGALSECARGDTTQLFEELRREPHYERVGVDRALAIAIDLTLQGCGVGTTILDVGCAEGVITRLLSEFGFCCTGIDSDVVATVHHWQTQDSLGAARDGYAGPNCVYFRADALEFFETAPQRDVTLLLSVLHHWLPGYGFRGGGLGREAMDSALRRVVATTRRFLYVETPIADEFAEMPPDELDEFTFPSWFLANRLAASATMIASSCATNGAPRRLFRVNL